MVGTALLTIDAGIKVTEDTVLVAATIDLVIEVAILTNSFGGPIIKDIVLVAMSHAYSSLETLI